MNFIMGIFSSPFFKKVLYAIFMAFIGSLSKFLSKVIQPVLAFCLFHILNLFTKMTGSKKLGELADKMKKSYEKRS